MSNTTHKPLYVNHLRKGCKGCVLVLSLLLFLTSMAKAGIASAQYHYCSWNRLTVQLPIGTKWGTDAEVQARWQSGLGNKNMFDEQLLLSYRHWVYYKPDERIRFSLSPFAYFSANPYIMKLGDEKLTTTNEFRATVAAEIQEKLLPKLWINGRVGAEYRIFESTDNNWRTRYRVGSRYELNKKYSISGNYELLFTTQIGSTYTHLDNERIWAMMGRNITNKLKAEIGLMHLKRKMNGSKSLVKEGDMLLNITCSL